MKETDSKRSKKKEKGKKKRKSKEVGKKAHDEMKLKEQQEQEAQNAIYDGFPGMDIKLIASDSKPLIGGNFPIGEM